jgi:hypothetical protein
MPVRIGLCLIFALLLSVPASAQDKAINFIKTSKFNVCKDMTVDQLFRSAINKPVWESGVSKAGEPLVEVTGTIGKGRDMMSFYVQFEIVPSKGTFKTNGMKIDGQSLDSQQRTEILQTMCQ